MQVTDADANLAIVEGRMAMSAGGDVEIYVETRDHTPLSSDEKYTTVKFIGDDYRASIDLTLDQLDDLAETLQDLTITEVED